MFFSFINFGEVTILEFLLENFSLTGDKFHPFFKEKAIKRIKLLEEISRCENYKHKLLQNLIKN